MSGRTQLIRDFRAGQYLDLFMVSAVSAILSIRLFLHLSGYPKVGGASLHVAHMLWGGLLMLVSIVLLLSYLGRRVHQLSALAGGVGFGTFIDEIGKFVTHDNDYFYQPAIALIYVTFVLLYLGVRSIQRRRATPKEYLVNALEEVENVAFSDLDQEERERALLYLDRSDPADPLVRAIRDLLQHTEPVPTPDPHPLQRIRAVAAKFYRWLVARPRFSRAVILFFAAQLALKILHVLVTLVGPTTWVSVLPMLPLRQPVEGLTLADWGQLLSVLLSAGLVTIGICLVRISRLRAFRLFQRSILVSIFLTQVFAFYHDQWGALIGLGLNLPILVALNFAIEQEAARVAARRHEQAQGGSTTLPRALQV